VFSSSFFSPPLPAGFLGPEFKPSLLSDRRFLLGQKIIGPFGEQKSFVAESISGLHVLFPPLFPPIWKIVKRNFFERVIEACPFSFFPVPSESPKRVKPFFFFPLPLLNRTTRMDDRLSGSYSGLPSRSVAQNKATSRRNKVFSVVLLLLSLIFKPQVPFPARSLLPRTLRSIPSPRWPMDYGPPPPSAMTVGFFLRPLKEGPSAPLFSASRPFFR